MKAVFVKHRPEVSCQYVGEDRRSDVLNGQLGDAKAKLIPLIMVAHHSADSRDVGTWITWLNAIQYLTSICTTQHPRCVISPQHYTLFTDLTLDLSPSRAKHTAGHILTV